MTETEVWGVVTAFRPDSSFAARLARIASQVSGLVVVDDGSGPGLDDIWEAVGSSSAVLIRLDENSGISAALNTGIREALERDADAVVTFDQDSTVDAGFVDGLVTAEAHAVAMGLKVGLVVPERFDGVSQVRHGTSGGVLLAHHVIQSGMLIPAETLRTVGPMLDSLFIDLVDTEFELRCRDRGYSCIAAPALRLHHRLGSQYAVRVLGRPVVVTLSSPFRYYYRVRNRVIINRMFVRRYPGRILRDAFMDQLHFAQVWLMARPRSSMRELMRGARRAGSNAGGGRIPDELEALAATVEWRGERVVAAHPSS